eukprot:10920745-Karenia_brevis.AAC.1
MGAATCQTREEQTTWEDTECQSHGSCKFGKVREFGPPPHRAKTLQMVSGSGGGWQRFVTSPRSERAAQGPRWP